MLDENLPAFYIKRSSDKKYQSTLYFTQGGHEAKPAYALRHLDPSSPASKNRYAVGISDPFIPDVLYGEVLIIPEWTQPSLSQDAIRANDGVPPPPEPILPTEFTIQLYNPEQQVKVRHRPKTWNTSAMWEFEMPQQTFRTPSASALDKTMSDPAASDTTPKLSFNWRKDGRKDLGCYHSGKTTNMVDGTRKKSKEPDITVAIFKGLKEITLYEPNLYRVEMEDFKGLELVLLLGAVVIRDVYFGSMKECFHISSSKAGSPTTKSGTNNIPVAVGGGAPVNGQPKTNGAHPANNPPSRPPDQKHQGPQSAQLRPQRPKPPVQPPPTDPRTQWELDQETRRLQQQTEAETRERRRREKEAEKRTKKLLEEEQKAARRRQAEVDQETERLKKLYAKEEAAYRKQQQQAQQRHQSRPPPPSVLVHPPAAHPKPHLPPRPHNRLSSLPETHAPSFFRPQQPPRPMSTVGTSGALRPPQPQPQPQQPGKLRERKSIFDLFKRGEQKTLHKKQSSLF